MNVPLWILHFHLKAEAELEKQTYSVWFQVYILNSLRDLFNITLCMCREEKHKFQIRYVGCTVELNPSMVALRGLFLLHMLRCIALPTRMYTDSDEEVWRVLRGLGLWPDSGFGAWWMGIPQPSSPSAPPTRLSPPRGDEQAHYYGALIKGGHYLLTAHFELWQKESTPPRLQLLVM